MVMRACSICGRAHSNRGSRCDLHKIPPRSGSYSRNAAKVRASATACYLCGQPFTAADPPVADHIIPHGVGGSNDSTNLQAAHSKLQRRKGAELGNIGGLYPWEWVATGGEDAPGHPRRLPRESRLSNEGLTV